MEKLIAIIVFILAYAAIIGISILGMMWGWGLEAKNWGWIMFSYVAVLIPSILMHVGKS